MKTLPSTYDYLRQLHGKQPAFVPPARRQSVRKAAGPFDGDSDTDRSRPA